MWKVSIEEYVDILATIVNFGNKRRKMQATLVPIQSKTLKEMVDLLTKTAISNDSMFDEVCDSEITSADVTLILTWYLFYLAPDRLCKISAMIGIDCGTEDDGGLIYQTITTVIGFTEIRKVSMIIQGYQYPITTSTKRQITEFRVSTHNVESYMLLEIPSIKLKPIGVSISYNKTRNKKYEASLDGIFTLNDGTKFKLEVVKSKADNNDSIFAQVPFLYN
ncbi:hypothetical protein F8M41_023856 [Gigaspora margarita]|uniref:Uncharacterized protein n=1 Tax=Gigaspora margarita TaxID=4874 RepID=A0A8H4B0M7_GIGMA|nr:hypothetical protein F8M41_023856 [Gigaspora margarita]